MAKENLWKTAYSLVHECYVAILNSYQDCGGEWIYECQNTKEGINGVLHRWYELSDFCL